MNILNNVNLNKNELQNALVHKLASAPQNPVEGQIYYNTVDQMSYQYKGATKGWELFGEANLIEKVKVNGTEQTITSKAVDISVPVASDATPAMDGVGAAGSGTAFARADHVHPADTSKLDKAGGTMSGAIAMGSNKITGLADGTNNQDAVTVAQLNAAKLGALKPSGSIAFASLPATPSADDLNKIWNITDAFTTTSNFVEGSGKSYPAGTNVAVINVGTAADPSYKFDAYSGVIDTSNFLTKTGLASGTGSATDNAMTQKAVSDAISGLIKKATGTIGTSATSATVNYSGTLISAYATVAGANSAVDMVSLDISFTNSAVTFTCANEPTSAVTCVVIYA